MSPCIFILTIDKLKFYCYINTLKINKSEVKWTRYITWNYSNLHAIS